MDMGYSSSPAYVKQSKVKGRPLYHGIKRLFDLLASLVALILLSPLFLWLAIKIHSEDGGPVFYSQIRLARMKSHLGSISSGLWWSMLRS